MFQEDLEIKDKNTKPPKKWKLIVFYKNGKTQYPKRVFETEKAAHDYYAFMTRIYAIAAKKISSYIVVPVKDSE